MLHIPDALRPLLNRISRPVRREWHKLRNRRKISRGPVPLPGEAPTRPERILCLAWFDPEGVLTNADSAHALGRYSRFRWELMNLYGHETGRGLKLPREVRLADYRAVFVHVTASYDPDNLQGLLADLADYPGVKVLMKQDEQLRTNRIVEALEFGGFDLLLTCVPPEELPKVYPRDRLPRLQFLQVLTGYVTDVMRALRYPPTSARPIDIGYRGSPQAMNFGWLPYEKRQIAEVFRKVCAERGLVADIEFGWKDRFFGRSWLDFLGRSKGTLGTESGGSVFDFDGEIERRVWAHLRRHRNAPFLEVWERFVKPFEGNVRYAQIAPRHFEAAACGTVQILYEGSYSNVLQPGRHYLSLRRDLANLDEVMSHFLDPTERQRIADVAFEEIVLSDRWHYRSFVRQADEQVERLLDARG